MMIPRRATLGLSAIALLGAVAISAPASADRLHAGGIPLNTTNAVTGINIAAGLGNSARQQIDASQSGGGQSGGSGGMMMGMPGMGGQPLVRTNTTVATNVAAGIGNQALQGMDVRQGGPMLQLDFSGRRPLVTTNVGVATNVAAGIGNQALQGLSLGQR
jgi:hypothetical protein